MKKILILGLFLTSLFPGVATAQDDAPQCFPEKVLSSFRQTGTLTGYTIEEVADIPSDIRVKIQGKEIRLVADAETIQKRFKGKKGKTFTFTYERVDGWVGDGCDTFDRLVKAEAVK